MIADIFNSVPLALSLAAFEDDAIVAPLSAAVICHW